MSILTEYGLFESCLGTYLTLLIDVTDSGKTMVI